jgi:asparagine synthase (glutamine-hydrolysing)
MLVEPDGPYVDQVVRHLGADHTNISLNIGELADQRLRATTVRAWDMPSAAGDMNTSLYMLFRAIREHSTVALSGEAADEVFGGYSWFYLPQIIEAETFPWLALLTQASTSYELFDRELLDKLDMPAFVADSYRTALAEVPHVDGQDHHERRMRELCYFHLTRFVQWLLDRKDRISMAVGLEVRVPFCDHRLAQYAFNTPWSYKTFDGREKSLLRAAARELVPESILNRPKSPYPAVQDPAYEQHLRDELGRHLTSGEAPIARLLDQDAVHEVVSSPVEKSTSTASRFRLELPLDLDVWLREYDAELRL